MRRISVAAAGLLLACLVMIALGAVSASQTPCTAPSVAPRPPAAGR